MCTGMRDKSTGGNVVYARPRHSLSPPDPKLMAFGRCSILSTARWVQSQMHLCVCRFVFGDSAHAAGSHPHLCVFKMRILMGELKMPKAAEKAVEAPPPPPGTCSCRGCWVPKLTCNTPRQKFVCLGVTCECRGESCVQGAKGSA